ncbi:MAG: outer membrane lipoprotein chaperone LolA [gamma proteobacterium symbiont of Lucinoma myriamae]|nr:outer membrane lipoprotein chaperone LolA [gamma proteobacterium symbiont of Lucinoma myriamae]MCU7819464.1 outer membrane lipoprotein chaperone LolA [gamma proteobacterium symbiont of Lucinoma myriamae]MCU7831575.1 outer membrane lipoprotein chaperone LolA [gamma proteobacterium symbiont of Lucinoma myriamae]
MIKISFLFFFFLLCILNPALANKILDQFFQNTQSMQTEFEQTIKDTRGKVIEQSIGSLILSRPDKFMLEYTSPAEQKYISNGKTIWIYDVELEQVSIKELDESIGDSPALLLTSNTNVYKHYDVSDIKLKKNDGYQWVRLRAKKEEMTFEKVLLAFKGSILIQMIMYDSFGQITELKFSHIQINKPFALRQFNFVPPEDVDVIGSTRAE